MGLNYHVENQNKSKTAPYQDMLCPFISNGCQTTVAQRLMTQMTKDTEKQPLNNDAKILVDLMSVCACGED